MAKLAPVSIDSHGFILSSERPYEIVSTLDLLFLGLSFVEDFVDATDAGVLPAGVAPVLLARLSSNDLEDFKHGLFGVGVGDT